MAMRKINLGMVGGGPGSFIGKIHYNGAVLDGQIQLVCGAFSSNPEKSQKTGREYYLPEDRIYHSYVEMILREKGLHEGKRMDLLCIATPNHLHFGPSKLALENGFHVISDKPLTYSLEEAKELVKLAEETGLIFAVTHAYTGYPMVKEAMAIIRNNELGKIRKVIAEYPQGWLSDPIEKDNHIQASWRTDPEKAGKAGCLGDIGTHALNLTEYITDLKVVELCADVSTMVEGRLLDDDVNILVRFDNGARGIIYASQVSTGEKNGLKIRIYGEKGGLEWVQEEPGRLKVKWNEFPEQVKKTGNNYLSKLARYNCRMPAGHPEGLIEAFANIYRNVATVIQCRLEGKIPPEEAMDFPDVYDGLRGMEFIEKVIESSEKRMWVEW